ncbi:VWA domain-containing protein [Pseudohalocynthiibacter aestuariivivens]|nr:VWA domain-containing protein [Pseudohalocynthiibacter aestuariivivens]QIE46970.1 VWA domain-containing protein [Pseudohalocynthiibacter aestuariivivens]
MTRFSVLLASILTLAAPAAHADEDVMVVFDGSNSMWGQIDGVAKIEIARDVMENLLGEWTTSRQVGLMAYGHRRRGDCTDIETLIAPATGTAGDIQAQINQITPTGKTPLTDAVEMAAQQLAYTDRPATVVLISDGLESCERDPCALARALEKGGVGFTAHVVGFGLGGSEDAASLACIAEETGGQFIQASNADELGAALSTVGTAVAAAPEPEPEPELPEVTLTVPETAVIGSLFAVAWDKTNHPEDFITIVPVGADDQIYTDTVLTGDTLTALLRAQSKPGLYEVRYMDRESYATLGRADIELVDANVTISGPESVLVGTTFDVSWTGAVHPEDYVTIVPAGADEGSYAGYEYVRDATEGSGTLSAGAEPGLYELRYVLDKDARTLATQPIEVTDAQVTVSGPETALAGSKVKVNWTGAVDGNDFVTVVPMGADEGKYTRYIRVKDKSEDMLQMPAETGLYELRYVLSEGARTLASQPIEITAPEVTVGGPDTALAGSKVKVNWTGAVDGNDFVTVVPMGADEGKYTRYIRVKDKSEDMLQMPAETGLYELRYVLSEGARTLASQPIEITAPEVTVGGPDTALAGSKVKVNWTGAVDGNDFVTVVPMGADEGKYTRYIRVKDKSEDMLQMPAETGLYELRYVLSEGARTLASQPIEVVAPEVTVSGPDTALAGSKVKVTWTGTVNSRDFVTIVPMGSEEATYAAYVRVQEKTEGMLQMPADAGMYELRYLLDEGRKTMARQTIEITEPEVTVSGPASAVAGSNVKIGWTGAVDRRDYVTIVPMGADEGTNGSYVRVQETTEGMLQIPADPGLYELRYILDEGRKTMARHTIEVTEPEVTVTGPEEIRAGDKLRFSWTGAVDSRDYIRVVPMGSDDDYNKGDYARVGDKSEAELTAPEQTGFYELRYTLDEGRRVIARHRFEVLAADAALNTGASLTAPDTAKPGSSIDVGWSVESAGGDQRITLARGDQAIFTWITAIKTGDGPPVKMPLPDEPGSYELRFLDVSKQEVLARKVIVVE